MCYCYFFKKGLKGLFGRKKVNPTRHFKIFGPKLIGLSYATDGSVKLYTW